jgi:hypothetical protein
MSEDYALIPLTKHQRAKVSVEDFLFLMQWKWFAQWNKNTRSFYACRNSKSDARGKRKAIRMNRVVLGLEDGDPRQGEHENRDTLDNRRSNLRIATQSENMMNRRKFRGASSRFKGVTWKNREQKWWVRIQVDKKMVDLGYFPPDQEEQAGAAYAEAAKRLHGEFARVA